MRSAKKLLSLVLASAVILTMGGMTVFAEPAEGTLTYPEDIATQGVYDRMVEQFGDGNAPLTAAEAAAATELNLSGLTEHISLAGLENCTSLTRLSLSSLTGTTALDLNPLKSCANLTELDMSDNEITGWTNFASAVPNLTNLDLSNNAISDLALIGGIETLTKLETLNVSNNQLTTIPDLKALTSLTSLDLTGNDGLVASTIAGNLPTSITSQEGWEEDVLGEPSTTPGSKEARIEDVEYDTLEEAVAAVKEGETITLLTDVDCENDLNISVPNVTIDGDDYTLTYSGTEKAITFTANGGKVTDLTIDTTGKYGVQFYRCTGSLSGVTINGGNWYSVLVNGADVSIENCNLNSNGWAGIDFSANSTDHLPKLTISSTNSGEKSLVLLDDGTMKTLADAYNITETDPTKKANEILEQLKTNGSLPSSVTDGLQVDENGQLVTKVPDQPSDDNPSSSSGSSSSRKKPERLLAGWDGILSRALHADPEDTLSFDMTGEKYVPASLIEALQESGAALELEYRGTVYTVTGDSVEVDSGRIYWPAADFLDLLRDAPAAAEEAPAENAGDVSTANPDTGAHDGVGLAVALAALSLAAAGVVSLRK